MKRLFLLVLLCATHTLAAESIEPVGECSSETENPAAAIAKCTAAIASGKLTGGTLARAYYHRGRAVQLNENHKAAIADLREAIRLDPNFARAHQNLAIAFVRTGNRALALESINMALRIDPDRAESLVIRATTRVTELSDQFGQEDFVLAMADLDKAIRLEPSHARAFSNRGNIWMRLKKPEQALADYSEAVRLEPNAPSHFLRRAQVWRAKNEPERALADLDEAFRLDPARFSSYATRARLLIERDDYKRALGDLDKVIDADPRDHWALYSRGLVWFFMGDFAQSTRDLAASNKISPSINTAIWEYIARGRDGKLDASVLADLRRSVETSPTPDWPGPVVYFFQGRIGANELLDRSRIPRLGAREDRFCEAKFYIAQAHLMRNERQPAIDHLQDVQGVFCKSNRPEYKATVSDLTRLSV